MAYAKVLGATSRQDGYLEGNGYLVCWCIGHLVELAPPNVYDAKYVKWSIADLPILPERWQYLVSASTQKQFGILQKLMHRPDVDSIVNSCDSGREGELIFRLVYKQAGCKKSFSRLWLSSMEESAIREGFAHLKPSTEYDALYNAALCRERADWMVGINASRLFSCLYSQPLAVGRVMTPVLAMTVVREAAIAAFVPEKFYTVALTLADGGTASSKRFVQKADAELLLSKCRKDLYRIPDGGVIQVDYPDGRSFTARVEHLDDYHFDMGGLGNVFHICQFAEVMERNHADFYPEIQTQDEQAAWELGGKGYLAIQSCEDGWDYTIYHSDFSVMDGGQLDAPELTIQEAREQILEAHHMEKGRRLLQDYDAVMDKVAEAEELGADHRPSTLEKLAELASDTSAPKSSARSAPEL